MSSGIALPQRVALIAVLTIFSVSMEAAARGQGVASLEHQSWSTDAGLPQASVHRILQSRDGYLWLATEGGVVRYDGIAFKVFSHGTDPAFTSDDVTSIAQDADGALRFGTAAGVVELRDGRFRRVSEAGPASSTSGEVRGPDGTVWQWSDRQVSVRSGDETMQWSTGKELPGSRVQALMVDRAGVAWIGTNRGLVTVKTTSPGPKAVAALGANSILSILEDAEGNVWIGTETSGLHALRSRAFREVPPLADEEVSAVVEASDGSMWIGTRENGLRHLVGTASGTRVASVPASAALTSPIILALAPGLRGDVWAGTPDGLNHIEADGKVKRYTSSDGLPDDLVRSLAVAADGSVWIGTRHGLAHMANGRFIDVPAADGLDEQLIGTIYSQSDQDTLWVGTLSGLVGIRGAEVRRFSREDGLNSSPITGLRADAAGRLWVATRDAGVLLLAGDQVTPIHAAGLPSQISGMVADGRGFLWLRVRAGVLRVSADELARCGADASCHPPILRYGTEDGLPSAELVANGDPSAWATTSGDIWFATRKGVGVVDAGHLHRNVVRPPVAIERVLLDDEEVRQTAGTEVVSDGHTRYTFEYAGLSLTVPAKVLYRTRLEGFDRGWSAPTSRRMMTYTSLPPGDYTFRVLAANNDGVWNESGASFQFRVLPPVYRRWWFLLLAACGIAALGIALYRRRVRRLRLAFDAVLAERNRIAREIHDTLAQDMVGASLQLDLVSQMLTRNLVQEAASQVTSTRALIKEGLQHARQSIWNLRANTAQDALPARIEAVAARFRTDSLKVDLTLGGAYRVLPPEMEANILRIVQEALSNVQRHSGASAARVRVEYGQDKLMLEISDNGDGFAMDEVAARSGHYGLQGMRERAAALDASFDLSSGQAKGTRIQLTVPLSGKRGAR
jgi:signal transduction histidine kinase/ligand-binding sensor domain-containing protein